jgi:hypothetical protein
MNILLPKTITPAMIVAGTTIPAVDTAVGEVAWAAGNYAQGARVVDAGYTYECVQPLTSAPQNAYAPSDARSAGWWLMDEGAPTNRTAPFDKYLFTKARRPGSLTFVLKPGFANGLYLGALEADRVAITVKAGGVHLRPPIDQELWAQAPGLWEYLFGDLQRATYFTLKDLPIHPDVEISITLSRNDPLVSAAVGFISLGNWKRLLAPLPGSMSASQFGMESSTQDYSYYEERADGTYIEKPGRLARNVNLSCVIDAKQAPFAQSLLDQILGKAVAIEVSDLPRYGHLATVGKVTGKVRTESWTRALVDLQIKGNV